MDVQGHSPGLKDFLSRNGPNVTDGSGELVEDRKTFSRFRWQRPAPTVGFVVLIGEVAQIHGLERPGASRLFLDDGPVLSKATPFPHAVKIREKSQFVSNDIVAGPFLAGCVTITTILGASSSILRIVHGRCCLRCSFSSSFSAQLQLDISSRNFLDG